MFCARLAPFAVFDELNLALHALLVLAAPIIDALALAALQFYQKVL